MKFIRKSEREWHFEGNDSFKRYGGMVVGDAKVDYGVVRFYNASVSIWNDPFEITQEEFLDKERRLEDGSRSKESE